MAQKLDGTGKIASRTEEDFGGVHPDFAVRDFSGAGAVDRVFHVIQAAAAAIEGSQGEPVLRLVAAGLDGGTVFALRQRPVMITLRQAGLDPVRRSLIHGGEALRLG